MKISKINKILNSYKKDNVILFIGIGILIVIFLYYNNLTLFKINTHKEGFNNTLTDNNANDNTTTNTEQTLPKYEKADISDLKNEISKKKLLNEFYKFLIPYEETLTIANKNTESIPRYSILTLFTKNFKEEIQLLNNKNNLYKVNYNNYKGKNNSFINNNIDLRQNNSGDYPNVNYDNLIDLSNGITIDIDFLFNNNYPLKFTVPVWITIKDNTLETTNNTTTTKFNKYNAELLTVTPKSNNEFELTINILNTDNQYPNLNIDTNLNDDVIDEKLYHQIIINLKLSKSIYEISSGQSRFIDLLENIDIYSSNLMYKVFNNENKTKNSKVFEFETKFMINKLNINKDLNEYTKQKLKDMHVDTLNKNYNTIVSDMFTLDNKISQKEKIIQNIKNHYLLNELSNTQNNIKFYNTY